MIVTDFCHLILVCGLMAIKSDRFISERGDRDRHHKRYLLQF